MWPWIQKLEELTRQEQPAVVVTVVSSKGSSPREAGAKMIVLPDGTFFGTIGGGNLEAEAIREALNCLQERKSRSVEYLLCVKTGQCCGGVVTLMMEVVNQNPKVYILGAGHVGQALSRTLIGTPFSVHLIDSRSDWIRSDRIPKKVVRHECPWEDFVSQKKFDSERTYIVIMTHSHAIDLNIIREMLKKPVRYIGLIGSRTKWLDFQLKLGKEGLDLKAFSKVYCPIGQKIGGKAPQEVAISAAAELLKIYYGDQPKRKAGDRPVRREIAQDGVSKGAPGI